MGIQQTSLFIEESLYTTLHSIKANNPATAPSNVKSALISGDALRVVVGIMDEDVAGRTAAVVGEGAGVLSTGTEFRADTEATLIELLVDGGAVVLVRKAIDVVTLSTEPVVETVAIVAGSVEVRVSLRIRSHELESKARFWEGGTHKEVAVTSVADTSEAVDGSTEVLTTSVEAGAVAGLLVVPGAAAWVTVTVTVTVFCAFAAKAANEIPANARAENFMIFAFGDSWW